MQTIQSNLDYATNLYPLTLYMKTLLQIRWEIKNLQLLLDKIEELKKNNPDLLKECSIVIDVDSYKVTI